MNLLELQEKIFGADEETLLLSRKHCHAKNVSSLVFKNNNGRLSRCFLTWDGHELAENVIGGKMPVGIHSHYYDLTISHVCGTIYNLNYKAENITKENKYTPTLFNLDSIDLIEPSSPHLKLTHSLIQFRWGLKS